MKNRDFVIHPESIIWGCGCIKWCPQKTRSGNEYVQFIGYSLVTYQRYTKDRIEEDSKDKIRGDKDRIDTPSEAVCISPPSSLEKDFQVFWNSYPRKYDKPDAFTAFGDALNSGTEFSTIMEGLNRYLLYLQLEKIDSRYIKYPATWLRKQCWLDEYTMTREITTKDLEPFVDIRQFSPKGGFQ